MERDVLLQVEQEGVARIFIWKANKLRFCELL